MLVSFVYVQDWINDLNSLRVINLGMSKFWRHTGQFNVFSHQLSIQSEWNMWRHGVCLIFSSFSKFSRHIEHTFSIEAVFYYENATEPCY